jgi:hypothetical protein
MKQVKVLCPPGAVCDATVSLIEKAADAMREQIELDVVTGAAEIQAVGVSATPAVMVEGWLVHSGSVPSRGKAEGWFSTGGDSCCA